MRCVQTTWTIVPKPSWLTINQANYNQYIEGAISASRKGRSRSSHKWLGRFGQARLEMQPLDYILLERRPSKLDLCRSRLWILDVRRWKHINVMKCRPPQAEKNKSSIICSMDISYRGQTSTGVEELECKGNDFGSFLVSRLAKYLFWLRVT